MEMPDFCPDFEDPAAQINVSAGTLKDIEKIQKRMGHKHWLDTVKIAIGVYDFISARNMGPGLLHLGVMSIDDTPSEVVAIDLQ